jgi:predicted SprT family Zn-dependent metalloprotease
MQPYELDIPVTWASMPSRDSYLAAKVRAWNRMAESDINTSTVNTAAGEVGVIRYSQREFVCPPAAAVCGLDQRWSFFRDLAACEMEWHGLTQRAWTVKLDRGRTRAGMCDSRLKVLSFSRYLIAHGSLHDMHDVLLHEIAHALAGWRHGHDITWRTIAREIGCSGQRCHQVELAAPKWLYRCSAGCWQVARHRRSGISNEKGKCKRCQAACEYVAVE